GNSFEIVRQFAPVLIEHTLRSAMKIPRPRVVSQALPEPKNIRFARQSQGSETGKTLHPSLEIRDDRRNLRLLKHEFRYQHRVRRRVTTPRKVTAMPAKPGNQRAAESDRRRLRIADCGLPIGAPLRATVDREWVSCWLLV